MRRQSLIGLLVVAGVVLGSGCSRTTTGTRASADRDVVLSVSSAPGLGRFVAVDGWTVYMYPPDQQRSVTCTQVGDCRQAWPPLLVPAGHRVIAGPGVQAGLIGRPEALVLRECDPHRYPYAVGHTPDVVEPADAFFPLDGRHLMGRKHGRTKGPLRVQRTRPPGLPIVRG